jgi:hypothetical protein
MSKRGWSKVRSLRRRSTRTARRADGRPVAVATATALVVGSLAVGALLPAAAFDTLAGHRPATTATTSPGPAAVLSGSPWPR